MKNKIQFKIMNHFKFKEPKITRLALIPSLNWTNGKGVIQLHIYIMGFSFLIFKYK